MNEIARLLGVPVVTKLNGMDFTLYPGNSAKFIANSLKEHFRMTGQYQTKGSAADVIGRQKRADSMFILMVGMGDYDGIKRTGAASDEV
jgi:hypothetical protein